MISSPPWRRRWRRLDECGNSKGLAPRRDRRDKPRFGSLVPRRKHGRAAMRFLAVHPGPLMYTKIFLRLEPLGLELVAEAARKAGHDVRLIDLQVDSHKAYFRMIDDWRPEAVAFSCNYLANLPEIVDLAKATKARRPDCYVFVGGHSASFIANDFLKHGEGAIDCVL